MQIEAGKVYRSRDRQKIGPMEPSGDTYGKDWPWKLAVDAGAVHRTGGNAAAWRGDGTFHPDRSREHLLDLVEEWVDEQPPYPVEDYGLGDMRGDVIGGPASYSHERWTKLLADTMIAMQELSHKKGGEYAGDDDRLANFRRNGAALGLPMETVWAVYAGKHWDAIQQFIKDQRSGKERERLEPITGRVDDLLVYLLLFKAMLEESGNA